jgi:4'-phosphopantetheinyl transferase
VMHNLAEKTVDVWTVDLNAGDEQIRTFADSLSELEKSRAGSFHFAIHRQRFIKSHHALRWVLGTYCGVPPAELRFIEGPAGKPALALCGPGHVDFNLSHSHDRAVIAVASGSPVGVDIERIHPVPDFNAIAKRWFAPVEYDELMNVPPDQRLRAFLRMWTQKEAYVKAIGEGLALPLDMFSIGLEGGGPSLVHINDGDIEPAGWWAHPLLSEADYVGAVVVRGDGWKLNFKNFTYEPATQIRR